MKHTLKVTAALVVFFFLAQLIGLLVINHYIDHKRTDETKIVEWRPLPYNLERPEVENESTSFIYITVAIVIGTLLVLVLVKFNKQLIWKIWFFGTVWLTLSIALAAFMNNIAAGFIAFAVAALKLFKPNVIIQNFSEVFIYGGLAAIFVPMMNIFAAFMLLAAISVYDFIAVFKTKHMIKLAEFQSESKVFAGLFIPYEKRDAKAKQQKTESKKLEKEKRPVAVLGGGDIGFTLIFAGVVMKGLMLQEPVLSGFLKTLIIPFAVSIALLVLLIKGQQNKFYPAMPVLSVGCVVGYLIVLVI